MEKGTMVAEVVVGVVVTVVASEQDMVGVTVLHQLLLQFKINPNSRHLVGSEKHLPENRICCQKTHLCCQCRVLVFLQITVPILIRHNGVFIPCCVSRLCISELLVRILSGYYQCPTFDSSHFLRVISCVYIC